jgi:hypothetical protein
VQDDSIGDRAALAATFAVASCGVGETRDKLARS